MIIEGRLRSIAKEIALIAAMASTSFDEEGYNPTFSDNKAITLPRWLL